MSQYTVSLFWWTYTKLTSRVRGVQESIIYEATIYEAIVYEVIIYETIIYEAIIFEAIICEAIICEAIVYKTITYMKPLYVKPLYMMPLYMKPLHIWSHYIWSHCIWVYEAIIYVTKIQGPLLYYYNALVIIAINNLFILNVILYHLPIDARSHCFQYIHGLICQEYTIMYCGNDQDNDLRFNDLI